VSENLEPLKPKDLGINDVEFYEVEQTPAVGFFGSMKGFWVTFSTMFKKPLTVEYP
jgi:NADH-quinone oxidoreductase subunit I